MIRPGEARARPAWRRMIVAVETLLCLAGLEGTGQLLAGVATPPDRQLPFELSSWVLPGLWLFGTVAAPAAVAAALAVRRHPATPAAVLAANGMLAAQLLLQVPFLGVSWLQALFGAIAVAMATVAWSARHAGWQRPSSCAPRSGLVPGPPAPDGASVELFWLPLGAGGHSVRFNGRVYEALAAAHEHRPAGDLYHSALQVRADGARYVIEMAPVWSDRLPTRGVVCEGAVGARALARTRWFRYEVRCWRDGRIPDVAAAVASPQTLSRDAGAARELLAAVPSVPRLVWGRDELGLGEMWNSNSVIAWLLTRARLSAGVSCPPQGRAPGWQAGCRLALRHPDPTPLPTAAG